MNTIIKLTLVGVMVLPGLSPANDHRREYCDLQNITNLSGRTNASVVTQESTVGQTQSAHLLYETTKWGIITGWGVHLQFSEHQGKCKTEFWGLNAPGARGSFLGSVHELLK